MTGHAQESRNESTDELRRIYQEAYSKVLDPYGTPENPLTGEAVELAHNAGLHAISALRSETAFSRDAVIEDVLKARTHFEAVLLDPEGNPWSAGDLLEIAHGFDALNRALKNAAPSGKSKGHTGNGPNTELPAAAAPDFNTEENLHADTVAERHAARTERG